MKKTLNKLEPYFAYIIIGTFFLAMFLLMVFWPKKDFPVKPGQIWVCTMDVIPFVDNNAQQEVSKTCYDSVYHIGTDGTIYYIENQKDSMEATLEVFTFKSKLYK